SPGGRFPLDPDANRGYESAQSQGFLYGSNDYSGDRAGRQRSPGPPAHRVDARPAFACARGAGPRQELHHSRGHLRPARQGLPDSARASVGRRVVGLAEQQKLGREVMNSSPSPQTNWKFILITVGGFVLLAFLFLKMFWFPWQQSQRTLTLLEDDYDRQQRSYLTFMKERKKLTAFRLLGLPKNLEKGGSDYAHYLQDLLKECGFTVEDVQGPVGLEARNQAPARGKKVSHIPLTFLVRAQGDWGALVKLLERFQRTPLLHRLKSWSVDQDPSAKDKNGKKLVVNLTVEALVVNHNDKRPDNLWGIDQRLVAADALLAMQGRPTGWAMLLRGQALLLPPMPERRYGDVVRVNPFVGG